MEAIMAIGQPRDEKGQWGHMPASPVQALPLPASPVSTSKEDDGKQGDSLTKIYQAFSLKNGRAPLLGLDLDGTTADFVAGLREVMISAWDLPAEEYVQKERLEEPDEFDMWRGNNAWFKDKEEFLSYFLKAQKDGLYKELPVFYGARDTLVELKEAGFEITAITARDSAYIVDTQSWVTENSLPIEEIVYAGDKKYLLPQVDIFIDDAPHVIQALLDNNKKVIIYDQEWNRHIEIDAPRITEWTPEAIANAMDKIFSEE
jgi:uncharacterized HAD superfamily protein